MKPMIYSVLTATLVTILFSCGNGTNKDAKEVADSANKAMIDSAGHAADTGNSAAAKTADMKPDAGFAVAAADGGMLEVALGKMAVEKGKSKEIKGLGAMMVKDHSMANDELKAAAAAKGITLPATMSDKCQKKVSELSEKTGNDFDKAYADLMVSDHKEDIDAFKKEGDKGNDPELKAWANGKVPTLEHHLKMSESAKKAVNKN